MLHRYRWRLIGTVVACIVVGLAWQINRRMSQSRLDRALYQAVAKGDAAAAERWLRSGASANAKPSDLAVFLNSVPRPLLLDPPRYRVLAAAARSGVYDGVPVAHFVRDVATAKALLAHGADPNIEGRGRTWVMVAASNGDAAILRELLARGGDVNRRAAYRLTVLQQVVVHARDRCGPEAQRYAEVVRVLLDAGADLNASGATPYGPTALAMAKRYHETEIIRLLKQAGARG
jgi:uncharacterized protein